MGDLNADIGALIKDIKKGTSGEIKKSIVRRLETASDEELFRIPAPLRDEAIDALEKLQAKDGIGWHNREAPLLAQQQRLKITNPKNVAQAIVNLPATQMALVRFIQEDGGDAKETIENMTSMELRQLPPRLLFEVEKKLKAIQQNVDPWDLKPADDRAMEAKAYQRQIDRLDAAIDYQLRPMAAMDNAVSPSLSAQAARLPGIDRARS